MIFYKSDVLFSACPHVSVSQVLSLVGISLCAFMKSRNCLSFTAPPSFVSLVKNGVINTYCEMHSTDCNYMQ